jgi:hypothetical protein
MAYKIGTHRRRKSNKARCAGGMRLISLRPIHSMSGNLTTSYASLDGDRYQPGARLYQEFYRNEPSSIYFRRQYPNVRNVRGSYPDIGSADRAREGCVTVIDNLKVLRTGHTERESDDGRMRQKDSRALACFREGERNRYRESAHRC